MRFFTQKVLEQLKVREQEMQNEQSKRVSAKGVQEVRTMLGVNQAERVYVAVGR